MPIRRLLALAGCIGVVMSPTQAQGDARQACASPGPAATVPSDVRLHTCAEVEFIAAAPIDRVFPLFGAERERAWAEGWSPRFIWPVIAEDREGMVFEVAHGSGTATWVNTVFDREAQRVQYVYVLPETVATVISLRLTVRGSATHVAVRYERTALSTAANALVLRMAEHDRHAGPEWAAQIDRYLASVVHPEKS
jgi:hypothetical protein